MAVSEKSLPPVVLYPFCFRCFFDVAVAHAAAVKGIDVTNDRCCQRIDLIESSLIDCIADGWNAARLSGFAFRLCCGSSGSKKNPSHAYDLDFFVGLLVLVRLYRFVSTLPPTAWCSAHHHR